MKGTFLFEESPLNMALDHVGYKLYKSVDKRYCWLSESTAEFSQRANWGTAIPYLHSKSKWDACRNSPYGVWINPNTPIEIRNGDYYYAGRVPVDIHDPRRR